MTKAPTANLDFLRAIAVTAVFVDHLAILIAWRLQVPLPSVLYKLGSAGVFAFFVHTSLVLMFSLERTAGQTLPFYVRRIFRIYPLSVVLVLLVVSLRMPPFPSDEYVAPTPSLLFANLLLVQNFIGKSSLLGPMWSLPYEVQMYIMLPPLFALCRPDRRWSLPILLVGFALCGLILQIRTGHANLFRYVPCFMAGVLSYAFWGVVAQRVRAILWPAFVLAWFTSYVVIAPFARDGGLGDMVCGWIFCALLGAAVGAFQDFRARRIDAVANWVARYSYGIYLLHVPAMWLAFRVADIQNPATASVLAVALTIALSMFFYHALEEPMIELGRRTALGLKAGTRRTLAQQ